MQKTKNEELNRMTVSEFVSVKKNKISVILDNVRSAHNVGSAFRTSDAFAIETLYLCGITPTPPNRDVYKTALGAEASVHWLKPIDTIELIQKLKNEGYLIVAIEQAKQAILLHDFDFNMQQKLVFVFGNEVDGVSQEIMNVADACIEIPQGGTKHSINVSVAIGIILWESSKNYNNKK